MAGEWEYVSVDQIKADDDRSIAIGPFGSRMKADTYVPSGVPVIRGNNIADTKAFAGEFVYVSEETADELRACNAFPGDLVFPHRGAIGEVGIVPECEFPRFMLSTSLMKLTCRTEVVDPLFIFYFFRSAFGRNALLQRASTVGTPGIGQPLTSLRSIEVPVPPLTEQRAIAHILGTLDDKIELLRKQNETLEAMARALFKAWFVDFEPVRAKMEGRWQRGQSLPGLPAHLYDLFPDRLVESELGEIPKGWRVGKVSEFLSLAYGKSLPANRRNPGTVPVYGSGGVTGYHDTALVNEETVIVGRKGTVGSLYWEQGPSFPIDTVFYVQSYVSLPFCYHLLQSLPLRDMNTDAAVPGLNRENVNRLEIASPPQVLIDNFSALARSLRDHIFRSQNESRLLAQVRDTLLPKLISGELRIPNGVQQRIGEMAT